MDRRPVGVALVILALAAVMVVPALPGLRSTGTAVPVPLPATPSVGDCVVRLSDRLADESGNPPRLPVTAVQFGSCRGAIAGEVVAFWPTDQALAQAPRSRRAGPCYPPMADYAGLFSTAAAAPRSSEPLSWRSVLSYRAYLITPSDLEERAGRHWSACLIGPGGGGTYWGTLRDSYDDGSLPTRFGSCWSPGRSGQLVGPQECGRAHTAQLIATGWGGDRGPPPSDQVTQSCARTAAAVMDTDDPTRGGQLRVIADRMDRLAAGWTANPSSIGCFVATADDREMIGLLLGLGDRPVPFAS